MSETKPSLELAHYTALHEVNLHMELPTRTHQEFRRVNTVINTLLEALRNVGWGELASSAAVSKACRDLIRETERADILEKIDTLHNQLVHLDSADSEPAADVTRDRELSTEETRG